MFSEKKNVFPFLWVVKSKRVKDKGILFLAKWSSTVNANVIMTTVIVQYMLITYSKTREKTGEKSNFSSLLSLPFLLHFLSFLSSSFLKYFLRNRCLATSCPDLQSILLDLDLSFQADYKPGLVWLKVRVCTSHLHTTVSGWMNSVCLILNPLEHQRSNSHFRVSRVTFHLKEDSYCLNCSQQASCLTVFAPFSVLKWCASKLIFCHILK